MECGEIDFAALLDEQKGKMLNMSFVGLYWQQVSWIRCAELDSKLTWVSDA